MNILPINNYITYNRQPYKTQTVKNVSFNGLSPEALLQAKFKDGISALDGRSVFIFTPVSCRESAISLYNKLAPKIDIPIKKAYLWMATDKELPEQNSVNPFVIYRKKENKKSQFFIANLSSDFHLNIERPKKSENVNNFNRDILPMMYPALTEKELLKLSSILKQQQHEKIKSDIYKIGLGELKNIIYGDKIKATAATYDKDVFELENIRQFSSDNAEKYMNIYNTEDSGKINITFPKPTPEEKSFYIDTFAKAISERVYGNQEEQITFADIGGLEKQKEMLRKYVLRPLKYPEVYKTIRLNKGILFFGPPRCGKTLLGKAIANEANVNYIYKNANEFIQCEVGSSEANIRKVFAELMSNPKILFIDEFDSIGRNRDGSSSARYSNSVVNQILGCMSDLEKSKTNSFVIAATNRKDLIDNALLASGRFGLHLEIPMPNEKELSAIYDIYAKNQQFDKNVSKQEIIKLMAENKFNSSDVAEMITTGYLNSLERLGINQLMDTERFSSEHLKKIKISAEDLKTAIETIAAQK